MATPAIGFRVECNGANNHLPRQTLKTSGNMLPRGQHLVNGSWVDTVRAHLLWEHIDTPFISFFNSWEKAKRKRKQILRMGARNVIIIAVWLKNKPFVYSAYDFAIDHGFPDDQVRCHEGEYLVYGGIPAEEYRILACFRGDNLLDEELDLTPYVSAPWKYRVSIPAGSLPIPANTSGAEALKMELYSLTGVLNDLKFFLLVLSLSGYSSSTTVEQPGGLVRVEEYLPPLSCTHLFEA